MIVRCARPDRLSASECDSLFDLKFVSGGFRTSEIAIDPETLAALVRARVATDSRIQCRLRTFVHGAEPMPDGVWIESQNGNGRERHKYDHAVNCLWEGRLKVDQTAGVNPARPWLYRVRYNLKVSSPDMPNAIPSVTIVAGPFGDVVAHGQGRFYLSWYPVGMRGRSSEITPPDWPLAVDEPVSIEIQKGIVDGLSAIVPSVVDVSSVKMQSCQLKGGIIFAWGETDIDHPDSGLHQRHEIGPQSHGRYHSIDTGKLTTAPLFANQMAERIAQMG